jgi:hypothetical protein
VANSNGSNAVAPKRRFRYIEGTAATFQRVGIFRFWQSALDQKEMVMTFKNNRFRKIYAGDTGIYSIEEAPNLKDIRFEFIGNYYHEVFCNTAGILSI